MRRPLLISASSYEGSSLSFPARKRLFRLTEPTSKDASEDVAQLLIDCEEDRTLRAVLVGMLREEGTRQG